MLVSFRNNWAAPHSAIYKIMWNSFETKVHDPPTKHVPSKAISGSKLSPNHGFRKKVDTCLKTDIFHGAWLKTKQETNLTSYLEYKSKAQKLIRQEHWKYTESLLNIEKTSVHTPRQKPDSNTKLWSYIKGKRKDFCSVPPLKKRKGFSYLIRRAKQTS